MLTARFDSVLPSKGNSLSSVFFVLRFLRKYKFWKGKTNTKRCSCLAIQLFWEKETYQTQSCLVWRFDQTGPTSQNPLFPALNLTEQLSGRIFHLWTQKSNEKGNFKKTGLSYRWYRWRANQTIKSRFSCSCSKWPPPTCSFIVINVYSLQLKVRISVIRPGRINAVLVGDNFPELR